MQSEKPTARLTTPPTKALTSVIDSNPVERDRDWTRIEAISCLLAVIVLTALMLAVVHIAAQ